MTREEEIKQAVENNLDVSIYTPKDGELLKEAFYIGAKWADNHPKSPWISVEDDLPCNHEELLENEYYTKRVLVVLSWNEDPTQRHVDISDMSNVIGSHNVGFYWRCNGYYTVTHWKRLPEIPKA